jgi:hypothetical protein
MKKIFILLLFISTRGFAQVAENPSKEVYLPAELKEGRFFLKIPTINGDTIIGFCDTGGGYTAIYQSTVNRLGLAAKIKKVIIDGDTTKYIPANDIYTSQEIPYPEIQNYFKANIDVPFLEAPDDTKETLTFAKYVDYQVFLGQFFFIDNAWTFNYSTGEMSINTPIPKNLKDKNIQAIGFKKDKQGNKRFGHPSMKLQIDGKVIDILFDTGATFLLNDSGKNKLGLNTNATAGSFIAKSVFDRWHLDHPDWRIIEKGEISVADLIEVPEVTVGNLTAGPVWFAKRQDEVWSKGMIGSMDKVVKGAIGGSFLKYFEISIDYPNELIKFEK